MNKALYTLMNRSTKTRYIIFQILVEVFKKNKNFETVFNKMIVDQDLVKKIFLLLIMFV